jgi:hypothetical protein
VLFTHFFRRHVWWESATKSSRSERHYGWARDAARRSCKIDCAASLFAFLRTVFWTLNFASIWNIPAHDLQNFEPSGGLDGTGGYIGLCARVNSSCRYERLWQHWFASSRGSPFICENRNAICSALNVLQGGMLGALCAERHRKILLYAAAENYSLSGGINC